MSAIDEFNPAPAPDYETLLFQFKALCRMYNSTRNQCSFMAKTICDLNKQIADGALDAVESERAANAQLTAELEALRQERDGLRNTNHALAARLDELCRVRNELDGLRADAGGKAVESPCESKLAGAGVFKGMEGLRELAECQEFWDCQHYGTRFYFGDGQYLHRGVLRTAVKILDGSLDTAPAVDDGLRADAVRYRWLRSKNVGPSQIEKVSDDCNPPYFTLKCEGELDAAIDAAMGKEQGDGN